MFLKRCITVVFAICLISSSSLVLADQYNIREMPFETKKAAIHSILIDRGFSSKRVDHAMSTLTDEIATTVLLNPELLVAAGQTRSVEGGVSKDTRDWITKLFAGGMLIGLLAILLVLAAI